MELAYGRKMWRRALKCQLFRNGRKRLIRLNIVKIPRCLFEGLPAGMKVTF